MKVRITMALIGAVISLQAIYGADSQTVQRDALTVLMYDRAALPADTIRNLEAQTSRIMSRVGLRLEWVQCVGRLMSTPFKPCSNELQPGYVIFRTLARCPKVGPEFRDQVGYAQNQGNLALLCVDRIRKIEEDNLLDHWSVMPYAAAHEIGHLLLGPEHAASGIMRAVWREKELFALEHGNLCFTASQGEAMRKAVSGALYPVQPDCPLRQASSLEPFLAFGPSWVQQLRKNSLNVGTTADGTAPNMRPSGTVPSVTR